MAENRPQIIDDLVHFTGRFKSCQPEGAQLGTRPAAKRNLFSCQFSTITLISAVEKG